MKWLCLAAVLAACGDSGSQAHDPLSGVSATATPRPTTWVAPVDVTFDCDPVGGEAPFSYVWDFGDGTQSPLDGPGHTYTAAGTYTATCQVTDAAGDVGSISLDIAVLAAPHMPHAQIDVLDTQQPSCAVTGQTIVQLSSAGSTDPDNDTLWSEWALISRPAGSTATLSSTTGDDPTFAPDVDGDYVVRLHVEDTSGLSDNVDLTVTAESASQLVTISGDHQTGHDKEPLAMPIVVAAETACGLGVAGETVSFTAPPDVVLSPASGITDASGQVATTVTAGCGGGTVFVVARVASPALMTTATFDNQLGGPYAVNLQVPVDTDVSLPMIVHVDVVDRCGFLESADNATTFTLRFSEASNDGSAMFDRLVEGTAIDTADPHGWVVQAEGGHVVAWIRDTSPERIAFSMIDSQNTGLAFSPFSQPYSVTFYNIPLACNGGVMNIDFPDAPPPLGDGVLDISGTLDADQPDEALGIYGEGNTLLANIFGDGAECTARTQRVFIDWPQLSSFQTDGTISLQLRTASATDCSCAANQLNVDINYAAAVSAKFTP